MIQRKLSAGNYRSADHRYAGRDCEAVICKRGGDVRARFYVMPVKLPVFPKGLWQLDAEQSFFPVTPALPPLCNDFLVIFPR